MRSFVFSDPAAGLTAEEMQLANLMTSYWVGFAKHGNPNGEDRPFWPPYTAAKDGTGDAVLRIELPEEGGTRAERGLRKAACDLQERITRQNTPGLPGLPPLKADDGAHGRNGTRRLQKSTGVHDPMGGVTRSVCQPLAGWATKCIEPGCETTVYDPDLGPGLLGCAQVETEMVSATLVAEIAAVLPSSQQQCCGQMGGNQYHSFLPGATWCGDPPHMCGEVNPACKIVMFTALSRVSLTWRASLLQISIRTSSARATSRTSSPASSAMDATRAASKNTTPP